MFWVSPASRPRLAVRLAGAWSERPEAEFVSLEEADTETAGTKPGAEGEEIEIDPALDADAFIEEQEEGDADVTDIIGDVDKEEEP